jgi:hypothetical protein
VANALAAAGLAPGDSVATLAWNGHRHVEIAVSIRRAPQEGAIEEGAGRVA